MTQSPLIEPPIKRDCNMSSRDSSDEPLASDLDNPPQVPTAGQKNQVDHVTGGDASVTDDDSGSEDSNDKLYDSGTDSDLDRDIFASDYGKVTPEEWAKIPTEQLEEINKDYMNFMKMAAAAQACGSQKYEDFQLLLANERGSGRAVECFFTFRAKGSSDGKVRVYEAKGIRLYEYDNPSPEVIETDTLEYVRLKDEHHQLTSPVST